MGVFQGHQIVSLLGELIYAFWVIPLFILIKHKLMPKIGHGMKIWDYFAIYAGLLFIPNSAYAMLEIRHLLLIDGVADNPNIWSFIVFGGIALIGLLTTLYGIRLIVDYYSKSKGERLIYNAFLSLSCGFGAVAGLLNFVSLPVIIFPPALISVAIGFRNHPSLISLAAFITIFLFIAFLCSDILIKPS